MKPGALLVALVAIVLAGMCVRMGAWQWSRWQDKRHANASLRSALAAPPVPLHIADLPRTALAGARVRAEGTFDASRHVLLSDRWRKEQPGVEVLTPLRLTGGGVVLVDRGWLPAPDGITAHPETLTEAGLRAVTGLLVAVPREPRAGAWARLPGDPAVRWSARALDADSLRAHVPDAAAGWVLRALPDSAAPAQPARAAAAPADDGMHLSYAAQWFLFAVALLAGAVLVAWRGRGAAASAAARR